MEFEEHNMKEERCCVEKEAKRSCHSLAKPNIRRSFTLGVRLPEWALIDSPRIIPD
jgi:hypothetical protein